MRLMNSGQWAQYQALSILKRCRLTIVLHYLPSVMFSEAYCLPKDSCIRTLSSNVHQIYLVATNRFISSTIDFWIKLLQCFSTRLHILTSTASCCKSFSNSIISCKRASRSAFSCLLLCVCSTKGSACMQAKFAFGTSLGEPMYPGLGNAPFKEFLHLRGFPMRSMRSSHPGVRWSFHEN